MNARLACLVLALAGACQGPERATESSPALVVLVRSSDGPIEGARVDLFAGPATDDFTDMDALAFRPSASAPRAIRSARADGKGAVVFDLPPPGRYWVSAAAPGWARETAAVVVEEGARLEVRLPLVRGVPLSGTIAWNTGGPLVDVEVIAAPQCRIWPCDASCDRTSTDSLGRFRFPALCPGNHAIWYRPEGGPPVSAGCVRVPLVSHLPVHAHRGGGVAGVLKDADTGEPLEGAIVRVVGRLSDATGHPSSAHLDDEVIIEARTEAAGRFEAPTHQPVCDLLDINVRLAGYAPTPVVLPEGLPAYRFSGAQRLDLDLRLRRGATLRGRVMGPDGPVAGLKIAAGADARRSLEVTSDADGAYRFADLDPGKHLLSMELAPRILEWLDVDVPAGDSVHEIRLDELRFSDVKGSVIDDMGNGVPGARVRSGYGPRKAETRADAQGRFVLRIATFRGDAEITADAPAPDFAPGAAWFNAADGDVRIALRPVVTVGGQVRSSDGATLAGARVAALDGEPGQDAFFFHFESLREAVTGHDGRFEIRMPWEDWPYVRAWSPIHGAEGFGSPVDDPAGRMWRFDVTVGEVRTVAGQAVDAGSRRGIEGLRVLLPTRYFGVEEVTVCALTGADGRFIVPLPADGEASVRIAGNGYVTRTVKPGEGNEILVEMQPDLPVDGVVRLEDGRPAIGATVTIRGPDGWSVETTTDTGGRFAIGGVQAGDYELLVNGKEGLDPIEVPVRAGARGVEIVWKRVNEEEEAARPPGGGNAR